MLHSYPDRAREGNVYFRNSQRRKLYKMEIEEEFQRLFDRHFFLPSKESLRIAEGENERFKSQKNVIIFHQ